MSNYRQALIEAVQARRDKLDCVSDVREEDGLLRVVLTLDQPVFHRRKEIHNWLFHCVVAARKLHQGASRNLPIFRGLDELSLNRALRTGIDVEPSDRHWYGDAMEKALEYGGDYPAVLIIDGNSSERPYRDVPVDASIDDHAAARTWSGADALPSSSEKFLRYSRLPVNDTNRGSSYETAYAWYIPGDPKEALLGVIECRPLVQSGAVSNGGG